METFKTLNFQAHAHIKDIIGQDMIDEDNIAVKELVKNSIDADATEVIISFKNYDSEDGPSEVTFQDNGTGMSMDDIQEKWLNMGYSSKKNDARAYAGSKGIGRFSADRLGKKLQLYTKEKEAKEVIKISIDWEKFENMPDWDKKINDIKFESYSLTMEEFENETKIKYFTHGTLLVIQKLRYSWKTVKLSNLKKDLEKFMIPRQVVGGENFNLFMNIYGIEDGENKKISGKIENKVFDNLPFKASYIESFIDENGKKITTELYHKGELLFKLVEKNKYEELKNTRIIIFYLNRYHKAFFKRQTGMRSGDYGSIFLYLNGFRVPPYGETANDWLGVDKRLSQGHSRFLGLRDILGRIELIDHAGEKYEVTSDREGIKRNTAFMQLKDISHNGYFGHVFRLLEKFIVRGLSWDKTNENYNNIMNRLKDYSENFDDFETNYANTESETEKSIVSFLKSTIFKEIKKDDIIALNIEKCFFEILLRQERSDIKDIINQLGDFKEKFQIEGKDIHDSDIKILEKAQAKMNEQEKKINVLRKEHEYVSKNLEVSEKRRLFAESHMTSDAKKLKQIIHLTGLWGNQIQHNLNIVLSSILEENESESLDDLIPRIKTSQKLIAKIVKLSRIINKANFELMTDNISLNIFDYISDYVYEIKDFAPYATKLKITFSNPNEVPLVLNMSAIEVSMLIDNIILNAEKHEAKNMKISVEETKSNINIIFKDDGNGLTDKYSPDDLFEAGVTTTTGSGMGLALVKEISKELDASVIIKNNDDKGSSVILEWKHEIGA